MLGMSIYLHNNHHHQHHHQQQQHLFPPSPTSPTPVSISHFIPAKKEILPPPQTIFKPYKIVVVVYLWAIEFGSREMPGAEEKSACDHGHSSGCLSSSSLSSLATGVGSQVSSLPTLTRVAMSVTGEPDRLAMFS